MIAGEVLVVHQALHGYAEGHRQVQASRALGARDSKTMLVLSDVSGQGARLDEAGYLTGYPLSESGLYALARTWPAPEMARPGCVWTHTLLIDFADLALIPSMTDLLGAFHRPGSAHDYSVALPIRTSRGGTRLDAATAPAARKVLATLYGTPDARAVAPPPVDYDADRLVMVIWSQQWPRLRRSFRFCTSSVSDRSMDKAPFDLQFLAPVSQAMRTRFARASFIGDEPLVADWLDEAIGDLADPLDDGLRPFLRSMAGDVPGGREIFRHLCRLHRDLNGHEAEASGLEDAITLLNHELRDAPARMARTLVATSGLRHTSDLSESGLDFVLDNLGSVDGGAIEKFAPGLGATLLARRPGVLADLMALEEAQSPIASALTHDIGDGDLVSAFGRVPALAAPSLRLRAGLAAMPAAWSPGLSIDAELVDALRSSRHPVPLLIAAIEAKRTDLAARIAQATDAATMLRAILRNADDRSMPHETVLDWLRAAARPAAVAAVLTDDEPTSIRMLSLVAEVVAPHDVPNEVGDDPWLVALERARGGDRAADDASLDVFLLVRAFGQSSRNQADLVRATFETVHAALARERIRSKDWNRLERVLPWSWSWFDWDRCQRLRAGVVDLFVDRDLSSLTFARLAHDGWLFDRLADHAARTSKGRAYLKSVRRELQDSDGSDVAGRRRYIAKLLK